MNLNDFEMMKLWEAVILQAINDLLVVVTEVTTKKGKLKLKHKQEAANWFYSNDIRVVCRLANVDFSLLYDKYKHLLKG